MQTLINIRMDETLKNNFDYVCSELGLNMSTAVTIFAKKVCREKRIPFEVSIDPTYEDKTKGTIKMTKFRVYIYPEQFPEINSNTIKNLEKTFDTFEEAYSFLVEHVDKMNEDMMGYNNWADPNCDEVRRAIAFFTIEFLNPQSTDTQRIACEHCGLMYIKNGKEKEITIETDEFGDDDVYKTIKNFVTALQTASVI